MGSVRRSKGWTIVMEVPKIQLFKRQPQKLMSEEDVKKMLGIKDFRHLSKNQVIKFISSIQQMDPQVAMKIIEQFPEVANMALGLAKEYREGLQAGIDANEKSYKDAAASIDAVIATLTVELSKEDITPEERLQIVKILGDLPELKVKMHKDDQAFILKALTIFAGVITVLGAGAIAVLGANSSVEFPQQTDDDDEGEEL